MIPIVAIVGRPNVGKSSLLNALVGSRVSIVDDLPGVTRDRVSVTRTVGDRSVEFVDTGGIGIVDSQSLETDVEAQIRAAIDTADILLFVTDVKEGITPLDREVAQILRETVSRPVLVVANKADHDRQEALAGEFFALGFEPVVPISAKEKRNISDLLDHLDFHMAAMPAPEVRADPTMKLAIVGKRNAGKSTLVNQLAAAERVIVSEIAGTTRDSVDVRFRYRDKEFVAIDTAGLRKQRAVENSVEFYSQARSMRAIRRADVVLLLIDAKSDTSQVDKKTAAAILETGKPVLIGINKWDLSGDVRTGDYIKYVHDRLPGLRFAPVTFISGMTGSNVWQTIGLATELYEQSQIRVGTGELNRVLGEITTRRPPMIKGRRAKFYYAVQIGIGPPTLMLFVNDPELITPEYQRFLVNQMRQTLPFAEVPMKLIFRERQRREKPAGGKW
jgi:GTP-binding protein